MTNQASIKYISSLLSRPDTITDGDHNSIALFRQSFPYFVPARYILTAEKHSKSGYEQATLSEIYPYMGNWVLLCNYLDASKSGVGQQQRLPDVLPPVAGESRVTDKKNLDQRGIPGLNGNDRKKVPGFVQGGASSQPKQVSQGNPAAKADPQIRTNMPKRVTEPELPPVMPEIKLEVLPTVMPAVLPEEIITPVQELPVAYVPEMPLGAPLPVIEEQVTQLSEALPYAPVATPEETILQTPQPEEVTSFPLYNIREVSELAMPAPTVAVPGPVVESAEALPGAVIANAAPYIEAIQEETATIAAALPGIVPVPVLPDVQAEIRDDAANTTADMGIVPQPVALDVEETTVTPVAPEEVAAVFEIPVMKAEAYMEPENDVTDGFKVAPTAVEIEQFEDIEAQGTEQAADELPAEPEQMPKAEESLYAATEEDSVQSPVMPARVVIEAADAAEVNDTTDNVPVDNIAEASDAGNTEPEESLQPEAYVPAAEADNAGEAASEPQMVVAPGDDYNEPIETENLIPPVYTEDYFLQQGMKVSMDIPDEIDDIKDTPEEDDEEKALMVMMSFSEWLLHFKNTTEKHKEEKKDQKALKTMWQKEKLAAAMEEENEEIPENVFKMAVNSITKEDGLASETLADVYIKQGKYDKAIEMYRKLSLRNPKKNAYFARRIEEVLKEKQS